MNQNDSKDPRELEQERLKLELEKTKLELERLKIESKPNLKSNNNLPDNLQVLCYLVAFAAPIGLFLVWREPKLHIIVKLLLTCFGIASTVVLIASFKFFIYPLFR